MKDVGSYLHNFTRLHRHHHPNVILARIVTALTVVFLLLRHHPSVIHLLIVSGSIAAIHQNRHLVIHLLIVSGSIAAILHLHHVIHLRSV